MAVTTVREVERVTASAGTRRPAEDAGCSVGEGLRQRARTGLDAVGAWGTAGAVGAVAPEGSARKPVVTVTPAAVRRCGSAGERLGDELLVLVASRGGCQAEREPLCLPPVRFCRVHQFLGGALQVVAARLRGLVAVLVEQNLRAAMDGVGAHGGGEGDLGAGLRELGEVLAPVLHGRVLAGGQGGELLRVLHRQPVQADGDRRQFPDGLLYFSRAYGLHLCDQRRQGGRCLA